MLDQLDLDAVKRLYRADLPVPVDVLNLIHFKDEEAYKWYGVMALPLLKLVGAQVGWMGAHVKSFLGEPRAEEVLVVRYPNQRRFFALALNPYYMLVANPQRMKAVRKFEASFTHSSDSLEALRGSKWVLAVHFHEAPDVVERIVESAGGELVYQSHETSPIVISKRPHPANTNPLVFKRTALFRFEDQESCEGAVHAGVLNQLRGVGGDVSAQLYRRVPRKDALPAALAKRFR
ncbi:MAG: NAD(P)-binding domain-containing protein [Myxococcales bacterium]|nr:NAD(P)-binding domain-containing protein [Myxococcales bacterium]